MTGLKKRSVINVVKFSGSLQAGFSMWTNLSKQFEDVVGDCTVQFVLLYGAVNTNIK